MANHLSFDMLSRLAESRGSTSEEPRARRHLVSCARCRSELEWLQRIQRVAGRGSGFEAVWGGGPDERAAGGWHDEEPPRARPDFASSRSNGLRLY